MIFLTPPDLLAVAARVLNCGSEEIVDLADLDAISAALADARGAAERDDVTEAAAALLHGLLSRRAFQKSNRTIAVACTLQFLALNGWDLVLEPVEDLDQLLDEASSDTGHAALAGHLRARARRLPRHSDSPLSHERPPTKEWTEGRMFERFTQRARGAVTWAQVESQSLNHNYVGTEHVLLGLIREESGVAAKALRELGISLEAVRGEVLEIIGEGQQTSIRHVPFTPRAKKVLDLAIRESRQLGHNYIGTEHILLGLIREGEGVAAQVLVKLGCSLHKVREQVIQVLARGDVPSLAERLAGGEGSASERRARLLREFTTILDEHQRLLADNDRLRELLRRHSIDPDS